MRNSDGRMQEGFDSRFDAAFQPGFTEADDGGGLQRLGLEPGVSPSARPTGEGSAAARRPRPLVDRFVVTIWIVSVLLLAVGIAGINSLVLGFDRSGSSEITPDYLILVIVTQVSPWLIAVGLAALIGTLFLLAARWERRP
ncbi:hypothetical protein N1028_09335 [Herbiconiux sp. CPCC 203407]|uniref:Uncharacterized protein n=1 Tax=Herbiconiux oxytropis TaxID=2970915 RepID=A0AA42BT78_9MICO|nr:hypothetical protein [Herbiconiux oxytropis]MCS5720522.1 hypothetical protein [Herbiconiux oxytropis]MCS5726095.1 hypothetical protein [Herbiconiux oxytropis]